MERTSERAVLVNGETRRISAPAETPLLYVLRNDLALKGTRFGCGEEQCGACMVLVGGEPRFSCTLPLDATGGRSVVTAEGLLDTPAGRALMTAWRELDAAQCGYCLSGILASACALLTSVPQPRRQDIVEALDRHLCRCGAHLRIVEGIERAAAALAGARA